MPAHRQPPKHRRPQHRRTSGRRRPGPARLTLLAAAATTAVGAASAGVALAAAPGGTTGAHHAFAASGARADVGRAANGGASRRATDQGAARQSERPAAAAPSARATPRAAPAPSPTGRPGTSSPAAASSAPFLVYDSVVPSALPAGHMVAAYATGGRPAQPSELAGRGPVLWIDVVGTDPGANVVDVEPGCVSPSVVPSWVTQRLTAHPGALAIIYTTISEWALVRSEVATLPPAMQTQIRWWIADPTGYPHIVPGSDATQWYWGSSYDISTATPRF